MMPVTANSLLALLLLTTTVSAQGPFGIQSNEPNTGSSSYAGSLSYDSDNSVIFLTGATYGTVWNIGTSASPTNASNCFFGILSLPDSTTSTDASWVYSDRLGTQTVVESCSTLLKIDSSKVYLGGSSEEGGLLTSLRTLGSDTATQYGTILDLDIDLRLNGDSSSKLLGGRLFHSDSVQSIRAMAAGPLGDSVYVVSQESDLNTLISDAGLGGEPNWVANQKFGSNYVLQVRKMFPKPVSSPNVDPADTLHSSNGSWKIEIGTKLNPVNVAGIELMSSSTLLLAGSAIGSDGDAIPPTAQVDDATDWAGFVTLLTSANGIIINSYRLDVTPSSSSSVTRSRIEALCRAPNEENVVYLVGSTNGRLELDNYDREDQTAFLIQLKVPELAIGWAKQLDAKSGPTSVDATKSEMMGRACAVTEDGNFVYVGGVVKDGAIVNSQPLQSKGQDDLFVALVDTETQDWKWVRQLGTSQDETLSDMTVDKNGNAIVLGDTRGSFMRQKTAGDTASDVFVVSLILDTGDYTVAVDQGVDIPATTIAPTTPTVTTAPLPTELPPSEPTPTTPTTPSARPSTAPTSTTPTIVRRPTIPPIPELEPTPPDGAQEAVKDDGGNGGTIAVVIVLVSILIIGFCFYWQRRAYSAKNPDGDNILEFLKGFDDVEVDLKHSATGGFHGTYVNHDGGPRFYSDSGMPPEETVTFRGTSSGGSEMSPLTHSSIVQDSLFSLDDDEDEGPNNFGGGGSVGDGRRHSSYKGLVDVYNHTWNDMSQHRLPAARPRPLVDVNIDDEGEATNQPAGWGREII
jgi:hypothetical protein